MIGKTFRITERLNFEFRAEVFNVSNTPPLNDPNGSFGAAAFGTITDLPESTETRVRTVSCISNAEVLSAASKVGRAAALRRLL